MRRILWSAVVAAMALASCTSFRPTEKIPDWVFETPKPDATSTYFVGQSSAQASAAEVMDDATANLIAQIVQYLGVTVQVDTSATAKSTLDSYQADIRQSVTTEASGRVSGFKVLQRALQSDSKSGRTSVYILASYATADLEKEKARIAAIFREREDAVAGPESEADFLESQSRLYEAVLRHIDAADAAARSGIDNADVKLTRNLAKANALLGKLHFVQVGLAPRPYVGNIFDAPFRVRLVADDLGLQGVPGASLFVSYQRMQGSRVVFHTEQAVTDADGYLVFSPPPPDFVGKARLDVRLDFQSASDLLDGLPLDYAATVAALESGFSSVSIEIPYAVLSYARNVSTALAIVDVDEGGRASDGALTQSGLAEALTREKFNLKPAGLPVSLVASGSDDAILAAAGAKEYARLIYGSARIVRVRKDGNSYIAEAKASVKAVEVRSGSILYATERSVSAVGADAASARMAAWRSLGLTALASDLLAHLP
jgi:hypothetical protein